jgi:hypothetical protein
MRALKRSRVARIVSIALWAGAIAILDGDDAHADSCTSPDLVETIPANDAQGVPTNALLFGRYLTIAQYEQEPIGFERAGAAMVSLTGSFDSTSGLLQVTPPAPLVPGASYVVHWPALRGLNTANLGSNMDQNLTAGAQADTQPPTFAGLTSISWDVSRTSDSCNSAIDQRYVFDLSLGAADDDGGRDSLTLIVFQTAGPALEASTRSQVLVQRIPPPGQHVQVSSAIESAVGHICFAAIVRDLTLKTSFSGAPVCVDTVAPPFFYGCDVANGRSDSKGGAACAALLVLGLARNRWRRRPVLSDGQGAGDG